MTAVNRTRATEALPPMGYTEDTAPEIRSYLARVRPLRGCEVDDRDEYQRGRSLIERLAISTHGKDCPTLRLTPAQCADVAHFIRNTEPVEEATWFIEPDDEPSHLVGLCVVLEAIESSLRLGREAQPIREIEKAVADVITLAPPERKQLRRSLRELGRRS